MKKSIKSWQNRTRILHTARQVAAHADRDRAASKKAYDQKPVVIFNASTRLTGFSLNAAFSLLTGWAVRLSGVPVKHFVCHSGMSRCVLGLDRSNYGNPPPCAACIAQSRRLYTGADIHWFQYQPDVNLEEALKRLSVAELSKFEYVVTYAPEAQMPLGRLVLPSIRWTLRRHTLPDDEATRFLLREYIQSAENVGREFYNFIAQEQPSAAVIFNGTMFPEATARWAARQLGLRTVAHEVGFQAFSTFFTEGEPTAYPIDIPDDFELTPDQNARLDAYLEQRFQGQFTMAGIRFWPEMRGLDEAFLQKASRFQQVVPVFTNVVYDTSQIHANTIFPYMFAWLNLNLEMMRAHPETLFVIRAHPDEMRPGTAKQSNESVQEWVQRNEVDKLPNVIFIDSQEYISSYELIQHAKFAMVYNSSIGLEAALIGMPVLCGGKARYTQYPIVYLPESAQAYREEAEIFLSSDKVAMPAEFQRNARRFLYYQLHRASLPMSAYLQAAPRQGFVSLKPFSWQRLLPENSPTMRVLLDGILQGKSFLMPEQLP